MRVSTILVFILLSATSVWAVVSPSIDFTQVITEHAMLVILLLICLGALSIVGAKFFVEKLNANLISSQSEIARKNEELQSVQHKIKQNEIDYLKAELNNISAKFGIVENKHQHCLATLPITYVSKLEFDRFVADHKIEMSQLYHKMEITMKDLKEEIKEDLETQMDRLIKLLEAKLG